MSTKSSIQRPSAGWDLAHGCAESSEILMESCTRCRGSHSIYSPSTRTLLLPSSSISLVARIERRTFCAFQAVMKEDANTFFGI